MLRGRLQEKYEGYRTKGQIGRSKRLQIMTDREFFIDCDGMKVHAKLNFPDTEADSYKLLILLHGITGHMEEPHIVAAKDTAIQCDFAVLRVELYGHGKSDGKFEDHTIFHWLTQTIRVIQYARTLPFVSEIYLAGHSQGGLTAILAAGMMPEYITGLIPMSPATVIVYSARKNEIYAPVFGQHEWGEKEVRYKDEERFLRPEYFMSARIVPLEQSIRNYHGRILLIHGDVDQSVPVDYAEKLAKEEKEQTPDFTFAVINGADHDYTRPGNLDQFTEAIRHFLKGR